jgi:hypothetical protein
MQSRMDGGLLAKISQGPRTGYDLSRMGGDLSRGPNLKKKLEAAPWSNTWPAPGSTLDLDFANNRGWVRGFGQGGVMDANTYTRASSGWFVGEDGLLQEAANGVPRFDWASTEVVAGNLLAYSEQLNQSPWSPVAASVSQVSGEVWQITDDTTNATHGLGYTVNIRPDDLFTRAVDVKAGTKAFAFFTSRSNGAVIYLQVDLSTGDVVQSNGEFVQFNVQDVGDGWFRVSYALPIDDISAVSKRFFVGIGRGVSAASQSYLGDGAGTILVRRPQAETGFVATPYKATGAQPPTTTPLRPAPTCNGLLIEEARTNRILWCRDATQTQWVKTSITAAKDQTGIDGVSSAASSLTATADGGTCIQTITLASGSRTGSVYLKRLTGTGIVQVSLDGTTWSTVELSDTEWRRIVLSGTVTNPVVGIRLATSGDAVAMDFGQVEDGAWETSPILTTTASATRAVDAATMQGENFNSWIAQGKGTMTCTFLDTASTGRFLSITTGSAANFLEIYKASATSIRFENTYLSGDSDVIVTASVPVPGGFNTASFGWQNYNTSLSVGGRPALKDAALRSRLVSTAFVLLRIGSNSNGSSTTTSRIKRLTYFPNRLSDNALQALSELAT